MPNETVSAIPERRPTAQGMMYREGRKKGRGKTHASGLAPSSI